jgi:transposase InsO family protein
MLRFGQNGHSLTSLKCRYSYDNALTETINGLYKTEVIRHRGPWRNIDAVEYATLEWFNWINNRRLLEPT